MRSHPVSRRITGGVSILRSVLLFSAGMALHASVLAGDFSFSGQIRTLSENDTGNSNGPAALANQFAPGIMAASNHTAVSEAEFHLAGNGLTAIATVHAQTPAASETNLTGWVNELYQDINLDALQISIGKKIVSWDVGYGFRPNDVVQQEQRRLLISSTLIGRPMLLAEIFEAETAWSLVWVNPAHTPTTDSIEEQALAARVYQRHGNLDLHGFARYGQSSGASLGAAAAWVATDALELHASVRYQRRSAITTITTGQGDSLLATTAPWATVWHDQTRQALAGLSYTTSEQHSFFLESWWDGNAPSASDWKQWTQRNASLAAFGLQHPGLSYPVAGNLAWQTNAFSATSNLRRQNCYARWSWQHGKWQPSLDYLWTPEDRGHVTTLAVEWQGDRWRLDAGLRQFGGPSGAIYAQLPDTRSAYVATTWAF